MNRNLSAYTALPGNYKYYPEFVSISLEGNNKISILVRNPEDTEGRCGSCAVMSMTIDQFFMLFCESIENLGKIEDEKQCLL